jgi:hypothetical protein
MTWLRMGLCLAALAPALGAPRAQAADRLSQKAELRASHGAEFDFLGNAIAVSGNTIVATSPTSRSHGNVKPGKALVFLKPWRGVRHPSATLRPPRSGTLDGFGYSVAMAGDTIVVGSAGSGFSPDPFHGRAYVYVKPRGGLRAPAACVRQGAEPP